MSTPLPTMSGITSHDLVTPTSRSRKARVRTISRSLVTRCRRSRMRIFRKAAISKTASRRGKGAGSMRRGFKSLPVRTGKGPHQKITQSANIHQNRTLFPRLAFGTCLLRIGLSKGEKTGLIVQDCLETDIFSGHFPRRGDKRFPIGRLVGNKLPG